MSPVFLAVDPGEKRIGLAISDPDAKVALPFGIITHTTLKLDAEKICKIAREKQASRVIIGAAWGEDGNQTRAAKRSHFLAEYIKQDGLMDVVLWDESFSTQDVITDPVYLTRKKRKKTRVDDLAAVMILREYLEDWTLRQDKPNLPLNNPD